MRHVISALAIAALAMSVALDADARTFRVKAEGDVNAAVAAAFREAREGDEIRFGRGRFALSETFASAASRLEIKGEGPERTILDFSGAAAAAPAITLSGDRVRLEGFSVENAPQDAVLLDGVARASVTAVNVRWSDGAGRGRAGLVARNAEDVLYDRVAAAGAPHAALVLDSSRRAAVRRSTAQESAAGLLLLNVADVEVTRSVFERNVTGVVAMSDPSRGGALSETAGALIVENRIVSNTRAPTQERDAPAGVGIAVVGARAVEVRKNELAANPLAHVFVRAFPGALPAGANPLPREINVVENRFGALSGPLSPPFDQMPDARADVVWDGALTYFAGGRPRSEPLRVSLRGENAATGQPVSFVTLQLQAASTPLSEALPQRTQPLIYEMPPLRVAAPERP